jgi:signal transduction histidine kinase
MRAASAGQDSPVLAMLRVGRAVAHATSLGAALDEIAEVATSVIDGAGATAIVLVPRGGGAARLAGSYGLSASYREKIAMHPELLSQGASALAIARSEVVWIENAEEDERVRAWHGLVASEGFRSLLALPLETDGTTVGALGVYRWLPGSWSAEEIELLRFFADHAATAVQTAQLLAERADQVAALERLVRVLQEQTHEHANRLHALRGLLGIGEVEEATRFLSELLDAHTVVRAEITSRISHPTLAGLLLAETAIAAQRGIRLEIDADSELDSPLSPLTDSELVTVVGNLLDNALDAVAEMPPERRVVRIGVSDRGDMLRIEVRDLGIGLDAPVEMLLRRGESTKEGHLGAGLSLVQRVADATMGDLDVRSHEQGTSFTVTIPRNPQLGSA